MLSGVTGKTSTDAFKRMEEKVEVMEARAEVAEESAMLEGGGGGSVEQRFRELEASSSVDDELSKMKNLLGGSDPKALGGSVADAELEALRKENGL